MGNELAVIPLSEVKEMSQAVAKSGLFGMKTPEQALVLMLLAQAEGLHPMEAARDYHIIDGRPSLKADTKLAKFVKDGGTILWLEYTDRIVSAKFTHPKSGSAVVTWTIEMAQRAKLTSKVNWVGYPRAMLRARVIGEGVTTMAPWVAAGVSTKEELEDISSPDAPVAQPDQNTTAPAQEQPRRRSRRAAAQADAVDAQTEPVQESAQEPAQTSEPEPQPDPDPAPASAPTGTVQPPAGDISLF